MPKRKHIAIVVLSFLLTGLIIFTFTPAYSKLRLKIEYNNLHRYSEYFKLTKYHREQVLSGKEKPWLGYTNLRKYIVPLYIEDGKNLLVQRNLTINFGRSWNSCYSEPHKIYFDDKYILKNTSDEDIKTAIYYPVSLYSESYLDDVFDITGHVYGHNIAANLQYPYFSIDGSQIHLATIFTNSNIDMDSDSISDIAPEKFKNREYLKNAIGEENPYMENPVNGPSAGVVYYKADIIIPANSEISFRAVLNYGDVYRLALVSFNESELNVTDYTLTVQVGYVDLDNTFYSYHNNIGIEITELEQTFTLNPYADGYEIDCEVYPEDRR